jgi:uncharacterized cupredoxin-like copper-binding protein
VSRRTSFHLVAAIGVAAAAITLAVAVAKPAQALPKYESTCSTCHTGAPVGTVSATPSKTTLTAGEAYTVAVSVGLGSSGSAGYWISNNDASTPAINLNGGPGSSPFTANMKAPGAAGTYTYKVWTAKGKPSAGQALPTTYQVTVTGGGTGGGTDTVKPTVLAPSAAKAVKGKKATLKYQVNDAAPNLGTATAVIKIKNKAGKVVKTIKPASAPVNAAQQTTFTCKLAKGKYKFYVTATDAAGNLSSNTAMNKLTVK